MKFLSKINRNYLLITSISFSILLLSVYFFLNYSILEEAKENLIERANILKSYIEKNNKEIQIEPLLSVKKVSQKPSNLGFNQVQLMFNEELETFLEYATSENIDNQIYVIKVRTLIEETEDLWFGILWFFIGVVFLIFMAGYFISFRLNNTVWSVFERNLKEIENFNVNSENELLLKSINIEEFDRLNTVINHFTRRIQNDYKNLKEFTENASHELQTPISVAIINLEEIIQKDISEEVYLKVISTIQTLKRLSQLNQSLILLSKIENKQFKENMKVNLGQIIIDKANELSPLINSKNIRLNINYKEPFEISINLYLADILINNLLSNAIKHNVNNGYIAIKIAQKNICICNTSANIDINPQKIFERFIKSNSTSFGLGLAIVKKICELYNIYITYEKNENLHCFKISSENL